ncbi:MAG: hypothetical protein NXI27_07825 [Alphaproteobacteria bacterium]|nr:hypothetical protein [Alphaproteobacteria bacterium]
MMRDGNIKTARRRLNTIEPPDIDVRLTIHDKIRHVFSTGGGASK